MKGKKDSEGERRREKTKTKLVVGKMGREIGKSFE